MEDELTMNDVFPLLAEFDLQDLRILDWNFRLIFDIKSKTSTIEHELPAIFHPIEFALTLCRMCNLFPSKNTSLLCGEDVEEAVKICVAQINKEIKEDNLVYNSSLGDQLFTSLMSVNDQAPEPISKKYKELINSWNVVDEIHLYKILKSSLALSDSPVSQNLKNKTLIFLGNPSTKCEQLFFELYRTFGKCSYIFTEDDGLKLLKLEDVKPSNSPDLGSQESVAPQLLESTDNRVQQIILSYLHLILNSRNEMSLSRAITGFAKRMKQDYYDVFTALRKEAKKIGLPMYQTASSFVTRLTLGGKGYAPAKDCLLLPYSNEIREFVELMYKLHSIVEENKDCSVGLNKVLNKVRHHLIKEAPSSLVGKVNSAVEDMLTYASSLSEEKGIHQLVWESPARQVSAGGSMCGTKTTKFLLHLVERYSLYLSKMGPPPKQQCTTPDRVGTTPIIRPVSLMFKTPPERKEILELVEQNKEKLMSPKNKVNTNQVLGYQFCTSRSWAAEDHLPGPDQIGSNPDTTTPVKTSRPAGSGGQLRRTLADCGNTSAKGPQNKAGLTVKSSKGLEEITEKKNGRSVTRKRVLSGEENEAEKKPATSKAKTSTKEDANNKRVPIQKSKKQIEGQAKMTNFFKIL